MAVVAPKLLHYADRRALSLRGSPFDRRGRRIRLRVHPVDYMDDDRVISVKSTSRGSSCRINYNPAPSVLTAARETPHPASTP